MNTKSIFLFISIAFISLNVKADEYYKEINKRFAVNSNVYLHVNGSFSNYTVTTWDNNEIEVIIKMNVEARSEERAENIFASAVVKESNSSPEIRVEPEFGNRWGNKEEVEIFVEIKMPKTGGMAAHVTFGNLSATSIIGQVDMKLEYGNLTMGELFNTENKIRVEFGNINLSQFGGGKVVCQYGNLKMDKAGAETELDVAFGNIDLYGLRQDCKSVVVKCEYGNADLNLGNSIGYNLVAKSSFGNVRVPSGFKPTIKIKEYEEESIEGTFMGGGANINANVSFGNVRVD